MEILLATAAALVYGVGDYCGGRASRKIDSLFVTCAGQIFSLMLLGVFSQYLVIRRQDFTTGCGVLLAESADLLG